MSWQLQIQQYGVMTDSECSLCSSVRNSSSTTTFLNLKSPTFFSKHRSPLSLRESRRSLSLTSKMQSLRNLASPAVARSVAKAKNKGQITAMGKEQGHTKGRPVST